MYVCSFVTPSRSACVSGRLEAQRVLLECLAVGSWLVKYTPKVRAFYQTYGRNVSSATTRLFYFIFLALRHRWVLIINISHTCSPAVGRKRSTFVFRREKKVTELRLKRWNLLLFRVKPSPRIPARKKVLESGGSLENHSYATPASAWLQILPLASTLLQMTAHQYSQTKVVTMGQKWKLDPFFNNQE